MPVTSSFFFRNLRVFAVVTVFVSLLFLGWLLSPEPPLPTLSVAASRTPLNAPIWVAQERGYFKKFGLNVQIVPVIGGNRSFTRMHSGDVDLGTVSDSVMMYRAADGTDFVNLATFVHSDHDVKLIMSKNSRMQSPLDLVGKTIAVIPGTASEYYLGLFLTMNGVNAHAVHRVPLPPEKMAQALEEGRVDGISVWEPYAFAAVQKLGSEAEVLPGKSYYELTFNLVAKRQTLETKPDELKRFLSAIKMAVEYINLYEEDAQEIVLAQLKLQPDFIAWIWKDYLFKVSLDRLLISGLENQIRWAKENDLIARTAYPDFLTFMAPELLKQVDPNDVSL